MDKVKKKQFISILLLFVIVFALGNLIYNIEYLDTGEENLYVSDNGPASGNSNISVSQSFTNNVRYVLTGFMGLGVLLAIISFAYTIKKKDKAALKSAVIALMGGLSVAAILFLFMTVGEDRSTPFDYNPLISSDVDSGSGTSTGVPIYDEPEGRTIALSIITLAVIGTIMLLLILAFSNIIHLRSDKTFNPDEDIDSGEMAKTIRKAMVEIDTGTDVRSTILRCYRDMVRLAHRHGVHEEEHLTPREFEDRIGKKLPISDEHLHNLILLFEEARYSDHILPEELKTRAMSLLSEINEDLAIDEEKVDSEISGEENGDEAAMIPPKKIPPQKDPPQKTEVTDESQ